MLKSGDLAPEFTLAAVDGLPVSLSDLLAEVRPVLLVFLRHLG